jgi:tetratricopeptide (TPR) repeat protein
MNKMFKNLPFPSLFVCFLIFIAWMHYEKHKATKKEQQESEKFWQREEEANHSKNKDISHLPMLEPDSARIPMPQTDDENVCYYQKRVSNTVTLPMMNLSQYTNTDLKLAYGVGNFKTLSDYDENFNLFLMDLSNLAKAYRTCGLLDEAATVYCLCLEYGSDKATDYQALAGIYKELGKTDKLRDLIRRIQDSEHPRRESIAAALEKLL